MIQFDNSPTIYWLIGYALAMLVLASSIYKKIPSSVFLLACGALLLFMRLPVIVFNREINPDESQMLSHAISLFQDPVYWKVADGTTIGPLDIYVLMIPKLLGFPIDYTSGRIVGILCTAGALFFLFKAIKSFFNEPTARLSILSPLLLLSFTQEFDFVHYSSEQVPVFLLAVLLFLLAKLYNGNAAPRTYYTLGLIAGMVPFAKLQAVPIAVVMVVMAFWLVYLNYKKSKSLKPILSLIVGGLTFPLFVLIWTISYSVFDDLIDFYLLGNVIYAGGNDTSILAQFFKIWKLSGDFVVFSLVLLLPVILAVYQSIVKKIYSPLILGILLTISSIYAITKSGNDFIHYLNFFIAPWTFLAAYGISQLSWKSLFAPLSLLVWFSYQDAQMYLDTHNLNQFVSVNARSLDQSPVVVELKKYSKSLDYMAVWGWQCKYYVEAQLSEATAENHSERSIFKHPLQEKYLSRYVSDLSRTKPAFFLDAVGKNSAWVQDTKTQGYENFPALADFVNKNYTYKGTFDEVRLYIRNDRF